MLFSWLLAWLALVALALLSDMFVSYLWPHWGDRIHSSRNVLFVITAVVTLVVVVPHLRRGFAKAFPRLLPLDPHNNVHILALVMVLSATALLFVPLLVLNNAPFLQYASIGEYAQYHPDMDPRTGAIAGLIWLIPCALVASGYGIKRTFSQSLQRLGVVKPTGRQLLISVLLPVLIVPLFIGIGLLITKLWTVAGWPMTDDTSLERLFGDDMIPTVGILAAIGAGIGEELAIRGLLQPRLGILLSNLFFVALHSFQYHWDGLVAVFLLGLILGLLRRRTNTVVCMIVHGLYDIGVMLLFILTRS